MFNFTILFAMNWILVIEVCYAIVIVLVCLRIIHDTRSTAKTLAYLLAVVFLPFVGIMIYFSFGINYRKRKMYQSKQLLDTDLRKKLEERVTSYSENILKEDDPEIEGYHELATLLFKKNFSPLTKNNSVKLLINGEEKFPDVLEVLRNAKKHIHIEYYIFNDDKIGQQIEKILIKKAEEGVKIRFIYDDFGSSSIRKKLVPRLKKAGIEAYPFYKIKFYALANRLNYRNHRKIIVVDGSIGFVGGINVSDKYINKEDNIDLYWRDTHLKIEGPAVSYLQYIFLCDWNACSEQNLLLKQQLYEPKSSLEENKLVQIAASGPDSDTPIILYSLLQAINLAEKEILITTPYFIPSESLRDALTIAAMSGVQVKLLVPYTSDSVFVNAAAKSYYSELLTAGVEIYLYSKGFIHAKTMVTDNKVAIIGSANMDNRSFELNFEVNAIVYDVGIAKQLSKVFYSDIKNSECIDIADWENRAWYIFLFEKITKLLSPML